MTTNSGIMILVILFNAMATAQTNDQDSSTLYRMGEMVVTATRSEISAKDSPSLVDVFGSVAIQNSNGTTVGDFLKNSSSVFLRDYGGGAALNTISIRGSASEQVLVLVDGNRFNNFQNGLVDLSLIPMNNVDRIEVLHGGSSAFYGADALGGVINILTHQPTSPLRVQIEGGVGSFARENYGLEAEARSGGVRMLMGYRSDRGQDDFPFKHTDESGAVTSLKRANSDFNRRQWFLNIGLQPDVQSSITVSGQHVEADRGAAGPFFMSAALSSALQSDKDANLLVSYIDTHIEGLEMSVRTGLHYNLETYVDPDPFFPINSHYKNLIVNINPQARFSLGSAQRLIVGAEFSQGTLDGNDFDTRITRVQKSVYVSDEVRFDSDRPFCDRLSIYPTMRYDHITDVDHAVTPKLGVNLRISREGDLRIRGSVGQNFRSPTFNDLYYRGYSNPSLKPERSTAYDAGVLSEFTFCGHHTVGATYFHHDIDDRILFDPSTFLPVNIGKVQSTGIELTYTGHLFDNLLEAGCNYAYTNARKRNSDSANDPTFDKVILYSPQNIFSMFLLIRYSSVILSMKHHVTGERFTTEDNASSLPAYRATDASLRVSQPISSWKITVKGEVNNILDNDYEVYQHYPMPGRSYHLSIGVEY